MSGFAATVGTKTNTKHIRCTNRSVANEKNDEHDAKKEHLLAESKTQSTAHVGEKNHNDVNTNQCIQEDGQQEMSQKERQKQHARLQQNMFIVMPEYLPDLDDASMTSMALSMMFAQQDLQWSFLSDIFFICGGILYVVWSLWDMCWPVNNDNHDDVNGFSERRNYHTLDVWAPTVYLINAWVDVHWANYERERINTKRQVTQTWDEYIQKWADEYNNSDSNSIDVSSSGSSLTAHKNECVYDSVLSEQVPWYRRWRKHAAHQHTLYSALTFGIAALMAVLSVLLYYYAVRLSESSHNGINSSNGDSIKYDDIVNSYYKSDDNEFNGKNNHLDNFVSQLLALSSFLGRGSDHVYIISALVALTGKRNHPWLHIETCWWQSCEFLEDSGDLLFLLGSLMDAVLGDLSLEQPVWLLTSSILWLIDACLYLRSDFVMAGRLNVDYQSKLNIDRVGNSFDDIPRLV